MSAAWWPVLAATQRIPFKSEASGVSSSLVLPLLIAVLLLAVAVAALWWARQKGWLQRWSTSAPAAPLRVDGLRVEQVLRLSPRTRVYRVSDGLRQFAVIESTGSAQMVPLADVARTEAGDAL